MKDMKNIKPYFFSLILTVSFAANAIVIRHDIEDNKYQIPVSTFPALVDFPGEGHGVLIYPQWVVTAAHVACMQHCIEEIMISGLSRKVETVIVHPGYKEPPSTLVENALASGDGSNLREFLALSDDIALIKLKEPIADVEPVSLFLGSDEKGKTVQIIGKGATGNGYDGVEPQSPHRTTLRRAYNVISNVDVRWISYKFDSPKSAIPLEGVSGSGDSGSPVLIKENEKWYLAGLASWASSEKDLRTYRGPLYGDLGNSVRISHYIVWIESTISAEE
ncbi:trypsin-like serine protease [Microbulbifer sp. TRSA007]|uniref:trypsin-like serine protease n=2 Tax=unclassified Microbulbifer TaxID=2619833 RepID=UPI0040394DD5